MIRGKPEAIRHAVIALLARGHLLIEDVPGVGKTTLARALATSIGGTFHRIQFTSDLLPSDIVGVSVLDQTAGQFEFHPGAIFANLVLADEINRTTPRTQSALLEAMNDGQVSVDGRTHPLESPFMVIATQNPEEHYGTYPLPESQMDRFLLRIRIDYPSPEDERRILLESPGRAGDALARARAGAARRGRARAAGRRRARPPRGRAGRLHRRGRARDPAVAAPGAGRVAARPAGLAQRRARRGAGRRARLRAARRPQVAGAAGAGPPGRGGGSAGAEPTRSDASASRTLERILLDILEAIPAPRLTGVSDRLTLRRAAALAMARSLVDGAAAAVSRRRARAGGSWSRPCWSAWPPSTPGSTCSFWSGE